MLSYILSFFTSRPNSVDDVLSDTLARTINRLESFREMANARISEITAEVAQLEAEEEHLEKESFRAMNVASRLRDLIR